MSTLLRHEPIAVHQIRTDHGNHIEPELDPRWSDLDKLRWHAGALEARTGVRVEITTGSASSNGIVQWHLYGYAVRDDRGDFRFSGAAIDFRQMWSWINGIESGFNIGRDNA